jgi:hypothetical protein
VTAVGYDGIVFRVGDRVELHPSAELCKQGARFGEVLGIMTRGEASRTKVGANRVRVLVDGMKGVHAGPPTAFRLVFE